jgi:hypothetical protein
MLERPQVAAVRRVVVLAETTTVAAVAVVVLDRAVVGVDLEREISPGFKVEGSSRKAVLSRTAFLL